MSRDLPRILVIRLSSMGDVILTTPALSALRSHFPRSHLDMVVKAHYADLFRGHPHVDGLFALRQGEGLFSLARSLRQQPYDFIVDLHGNLRSRALSALLPAAKKVRYHKRALRRRAMVWFRHKSGQPVHTVDLYLRSLRPLGIQAGRRPPRLYLLPEDEDFAERFLEEHHLIQKSTLVGLCPGARWPGKRWPAERFAKLGRELTRCGHRGFLVFGGPGEEELVNQVVEQMVPHGIAAVGLSFRQLMGLVARCGLFVTNDSGPMHMATALGVPVVAIFGPTHPCLGFWPLGKLDVTLTANLDCSPCSLHGRGRCPRNWSCLEGVKVQDVLQAAENILNRAKDDILRKTISSIKSESNMANRAVFLDRDGTINEEIHYLQKPEQLALLPGAGEAIRKLNDLGLKVVLVTNQSGVARGYLTEEKLHQIHELLQKMLAEHGARLDAIYYCPEMPDSGSRCRKPETGMMEQAAREHDIDLKRSYVVGDMTKDIEMGQRAGSKTVLVLTGYGLEAKDQVQPDHIARDLCEAVDWIEHDLKGT